MLKKRIKGLGCDIINVNIIKKMLSKYDRKTLTYLFTEKELNISENDHDAAKTLAICYCSKESIGKALGTGLAGIAWNHIETIVKKQHLEIYLYNSALQVANEKNIKEWVASYCLFDELVLVTVIGQ